MSQNDKLLEIKGLTVQYVTADGAVHAVTNLNLSVLPGETLGLVGETGAGKTTTVKTIMRILPDPPSKICGGEILFEGQDLLKLHSSQMRKIRGEKISMIFQDPMTSLNPVLTVEKQIAEAIALHSTLSRPECLQKALDMLEMVGIRRERGSDFPHQFSGGMKQRVVIAMALACNPSLLIADEPTTALDVTIQAQVLELMKDLKKKYNMSMIMITHDLGIVAEICDHVAIMYAGEIVEQGTTRQIFNYAAHPYTIGLFNCIPDLSDEKDTLIPIKGLMPDPSDLPKGCRFHPRCSVACEECSIKEPPVVEVEPGHFVRCIKAKASGGEQNG
ncbi:MAG: ABC transporter ATP-binding protein [Clostridiaceae bacterium]|nr:ABC transporter ATP-binding protein [Clostridiaceae bacterium]